MPSTQISFIRHGDVHNPHGIFYGRLPRFRLSAEGIRRVQATARFLRRRPLAAIFSSPFLRARQTALIIQASRHHVPLHISKLLGEIHTPFQGRPISEALARGWDIYSGIPAEFEQPADILKRTRKFIAQARRAYSGRHTVAVTHGDTIVFLILWAKSAPITPEAKQDFRQLGFPHEYPEPGSVTTLTFRTAGADELPGVKYVSP